MAKPGGMTGTTRTGPEFPALPEALRSEEVTGGIIYTIMWRKMQSTIGSYLNSTRDFIKNALGLEGRALDEVSLYAIRVARTATADIFNELEARFEKKVRSE